MSGQNIPPRTDVPRVSQPWLPPAAIDAALNLLNPTRGPLPVLIILHQDMTGSLVAVEEDTDPDAWLSLGEVATLGWLAAALARTPWTVTPPPGFCLLTPTGTGNLIGWAADRNGGIYELTVAAPGQLRIRHYLTAGPARRDQPLPLVARALAGVALAASGHHPAAFNRMVPPPPTLLLGGDEDLFDELDGQTRYRIVHYPRGIPTLEVWAGAPLAFVAADAGDRCRDLPLRPDVVYLRDVGGPHEQRSEEHVRQLDAMAIVWQTRAGWQIQWLLGAAFGRGR